MDTETGRELKTVDISEAVQKLGIDWIYDWTIDHEGRSFLAAEGQVAALDSGGQVLFTVDAELTPSGLEGSDGGILARLSDGSLAVLTVKKPDGSRVVRTIDPDVRGWREHTYPLSGNVTQIFDGRGENLFFYIADDLLFGWTVNEEMPSKLLSCSSAQLPGFCDDAGGFDLDESFVRKLINVLLHSVRTHTNGLTDGFAAGTLFPNLKFGNNAFDESCFARRCNQRQLQNMAILLPTFRFGSNGTDKLGSTGRSAEGFRALSLGGDERSGKAG